MRIASLCRTLAVAPRFFTIMQSSTVLAVLLTCFCGSAQAQTNEWTWVTGSSTVPANGSSEPAVYGTQGVAAPGNTPGSRDAGVGWTDLSGNLWLFGGEGQAVNDLWKFNISTNEWTWIAGSNTTGAAVYGTLGVAAAGNVPGARVGAAAWTDSGGHLWLFGGTDYSGGTNGYLNDIWEFDTGSKQWTWMGGSNVSGKPGVYGTQGTAAQGNTPGARTNPVAWHDASGNLWLFGGYGLDSQTRIGYLNDVWKFDVSAKQWTWESGPNTMSNCVSDSFGVCLIYGQAGVYGTLGSPSSTNTPGGRLSAVAWGDSNGSLWLFGGYGVDQASFTGELDDLWEYNISSGQWTWMSGNGTAVRTSAYGTLGVSSSTNLPPGRLGGTGWVDSAGNLWMFGGFGYDAAGDLGLFDDLWVFDPSNQEWAWMGGESSFTFCLDLPTSDSPGFRCGQIGVYGTQGTPAVGNQPGPRFDPVSWVDGGGGFWLYGGTGFTSSTASTYILNDLWHYEPSANSLPPAITPVFSPAPGTYFTPQTVTISNGMSNATIYYTTDGTTPTTNSTAYSGPTTVSSTQTLEAIAVATGYPTSAVSSATYMILPLAATPTFSVAAGTYTSPQTVAISDATPGATIYYTTDLTTPTSGSTLYSGPITVTASETIKAIAVATGYGPSAVASADYSLPVTFQLAASPSAITVKAGSQGTVTLTLTPQNGFNSTVSFECVGGLPMGASCSFNPATVTVASATTVSMTITTTTQSAALGRDVRQIFPGGALAVAMCIFGWRRRRTARLLLLIIGFGACVGLISACNSSKRAQPPVVHNVTVNAKSGSVQQSTVVSLTLN